MADGTLFFDRQVELQEQRSIRLREWERRLVRLQDELEELERRIEDERLRPLGPIGTEIGPTTTQ